MSHTSADIQEAREVLAPLNYHVDLGADGVRLCYCEDRRGAKGTITKPFPLRAVGTGVVQVPPPVRGTASRPVMSWRWLLCGLLTQGPVQASPPS